VLSQVLPERGIVLEVGSGTGQHALQFARAMPNLIWQPSECDPDCLRSILAWLAVEEFPNVRPPVHLDVCALPWAIDSAAALVCINLIHIAAWSATKALFCGGRSLLSGSGLLCLYGPFQRQGRQGPRTRRHSTRSAAIGHPESKTEPFAQECLSNGTLGFEEPDMKSIPVVLQPGLTNSLSHLRLHKDTLESVLSSDALWQTKPRRPRASWHQKRAPAPRGHSRGTLSL